MYRIFASKGYPKLYVDMFAELLTIVVCIGQSYLQGETLSFLGQYTMLSNTCGY